MPAGHDLPSIGTMSAIPPALRYRVLDLVARFAHGDADRARLAQLVEVGAGWLGAEPSLRELGAWLVDARHDPGIRVLGCAWLAMYPTLESIDRLAGIVGLATTPAPVRDAAIRVLADRQVRALHPSTLWSAAAVQLADDTLFKLADTATTEGRLDPALPLALRHVQSDGLAAVFARAPALWGNALECFATAPLARVLAVSIDDIAPVHRIRVLRLIAATLGEDTIPFLIARGSSPAATREERLESLFLAVSLGGEPQLPRLETALRDGREPELARKRARWHLANTGVIPTVRGLRIARSTATLPAAERTAKCGQAADDLAALTRFGRCEPEVYELWAWMVRAAGDPVRARELVAAHPASQVQVRDLHLADLARRGRVKQLMATASECPDLGALQLAIWGRPFAALELAVMAKRHTPELVCALSLACYRAGRPDLAEAILSSDLPPPEIALDEGPHEFPGSDERWLAEHAPDHRPAIAALVRGREGVLALASGAHHDAEPDAASFDGLAEIARRLRRELRGAAVYLAGEFKAADRSAISAAIERAGARIVAGPLPGTELYIAGDCSPHLIAQLERQGVRRLPLAEVLAR